MTASALSRARNSTIRRAGLGRPPAASPPHAKITRRRCCPTARCSSQAVLTCRCTLSRARNSTIRRAGLGRPPAASPPHALHHTATLLPNGKVLVAGGMTVTLHYLASAELYDPASGTWTATGSLATARYCHTATLLPNGKVLVAGGDHNVRRTSRARNSTIRRAGPGRPPAASPPHAIITRRHCCPTARCSSQAVYGSLASAELYDPASGTWTATGSLATARDCPHGDVAAQRQGARRRRYWRHAADLASAELYDVGLGFSSAWQPAHQLSQKPASASSSPARGSKASRKRLAATPRIHRAITQSCSCAASTTARLLSSPSIRSRGWSDTSFTSLPVRKLSFRPGAGDCLYQRHSEHCEVSGRPTTRSIKSHKRTTTFSDPRFPTSASLLKLCGWRWIATETLTPDGPR